MGLAAFNRIRRQQAEQEHAGEAKAEPKQQEQPAKAKKPAKAKD